MKQDLTPIEALERIKLMMKYDLKKTLNENVGEQVTTDQSKTTAVPKMDDSATQEYLKKVAQSFLKYPQNIKTDFGSPTADVKKIAEDIKSAISGINVYPTVRNKKLKEIGTLLSTAKFENIIGLLKVYPEVGGESLYEALDGEYFAGDILENVVSIVSSNLGKWCMTKGAKPPSICIPKSGSTMRYGNL